MAGEHRSHGAEAFAEAGCLPDYLQGVLRSGCKAAALARDMAVLLIDAARVLPSLVATVANERLERSIVCPSYDPSDYQSEDASHGREVLGRILSVATLGVGDKIGRVMSKISM